MHIRMCRFMHNFLNFVVKVNENYLVYLFRHAQTALSLHPSTSPYIPLYIPFRPIRVVVDRLTWLRISAGNDHYSYEIYVFFSLRTHKYDI